MEKYGSSHWCLKCNARSKGDSSAKEKQLNIIKFKKIGVFASCCNEALQAADQAVEASTLQCPTVLCVGLVLKDPRGWRMIHLDLFNYLVLLIWVTCDMFSPFSSTAPQFWRDKAQLRKRLDDLHGKTTTLLERCQEVPAESQPASSAVFCHLSTSHTFLQVLRKDITWTCKSVLRVWLPACSFYDSD